MQEVTCMSMLYACMLYYVHVTCMYYVMHPYVACYRYILHVLQVHHKHVFMLVCIQLEPASLHAWNGLANSDFCLAFRYRNGMRGRTRAVILELLKEYHRVEDAFQGGYEKGVQVLRKQHSENMEKVAADIFAHYYISGRNKLTIKLIVRQSVQYIGIKC